jgi:hypothetical protein
MNYTSRNRMITASRMPPPIGVTVITDNVVQTFKVTIRSLNGVHPETLKRVIQSRYEVTDIETLTRTTLVRPAN